MYFYIQFRRVNVAKNNIRLCFSKRIHFSTEKNLIVNNDSLFSLMWKVQQTKTSNQTQNFAFLIIRQSYKRNVCLKKDQVIITFLDGDLNLDHTNAQFLSKLKYHSVEELGINLNFILRQNIKMSYIGLHPYLHHVFS